MVEIVAKSLQKSKAPTKVCFFAWVATIGKIPMEDMLKRSNLSGLSRCPICLEEKETVDHLRQFGIYLSLMGVSWVQPSNVRDMVVTWRRRMEKRWVFGVWNMVPLTICGLLGRRDINVFFRTKLCRFKNLSSIFEFVV